MYAIVKTGGKQYKVAPGDKLNIEKLDAEVGAKVELEAICIVDGKKVEADPAKAAATKVTAIILEQFKGEKQLVFKFKKRKNYKKLRGHRQQLTRVEIESVGAAKPKAAAAKTATKPAADAAEKKPAATKAAAAKPATAAAKKPAAKTASTAAAKKPAAKSTTAAATKAAAKPATAAAKKPAAKKAAAKPASTDVEKKPAAKKAAAKPASTDAE